MLSLKKILHELMEIQQETDNVIEFPNENFVMTIFRPEKKLLFSPQQHQSLPGKVRTYVNMIKQNFNVLKVKDKGAGTFELEFDPREDFESAIDFVKTQLDK
jgi:hypothetical protein